MASPTLEENSNNLPDGVGPSIRSQGLPITENDKLSTESKTKTSNAESVREIHDEEKHPNHGDSDPHSPKLGIYATSPITMVVAYVLGLGFALGIHTYYSRLNGTKVGDADEQQMAFRIGTVLAYLAQVCLVGSVYFSYVQCLWRALKNSRISVRAVNAGFDATNSLMSFLNLEMISKLRLASVLAVIAW